jgi:hypothetical protein
MFPIGTKVHFFEDNQVFSLLVAGFNEKDNTYLLSKVLPSSHGYPVPKHLVFGSIPELRDYYRTKSNQFIGNF